MLFFFCSHFPSSNLGSFHREFEQDLERPNQPLAGAVDLAAFIDLELFPILYKFCGCFARLFHARLIVKNGTARYCNGCRG